MVTGKRDHSQAVGACWMQLVLVEIQPQHVVDATYVARVGICIIAGDLFMWLSWGLTACLSDMALALASS